jgi:hypothetical protein
MSPPKKLCSALSRVLGYSALAVWLGHFYFWFSYFDSSPRQPDYASGHVIPLNNHGSVHYLTASQDQNITRMELAAFLLFAVGFLIQELIVRPPKPKPWENKV